MRFLVLLFAMLPMINHAQTNYHFHHTVVTEAHPASIWKIWTDVAGWKKWDSGLKDAILNEPFGAGAKGKLIPDKGPKSKFVVSEYYEGVGYTFKTRIPLGWLKVKRYLTSEGNQTSFTHEVTFTGLLRNPLGNSIGKRYRAMLPEVMNNIKTLAEN